jgi:uncharacterized membrane protein
MGEITGRRRSAGKLLKGSVYLAVGVLLIGWLLNTPGGLMGKADAVGYAVCHRIAVRSFFFGERQLPLCARCSGMYLGAMLALVYQAFLSPRRGGLPRRGVLWMLIFFVLAFVLDGLNSFLSFFPGAPLLYTPANWLRLLTGTGMGIAIALALYPAFNQTVWAEWDSRPALAGLRQIGGLLLLAALVYLMLLSDNPLLLYPLALISAAGVLVLLTMAYSMVWMMFLRAENTYNRLSQMIFPLVGGFGFALLQIALFDLLRFAFTGTWDGFHLG